MSNTPHILILKACFYEDIATHLEKGAMRALDRVGATYEIVALPGALEIPVALSLACGAGCFSPKTPKYQGAIALGCVIRGETSHYEIVSNDSSRGLLELALRYHIPIGNGILTVENKGQAHARLSPDNHKGEAAAEACLALISVNEKWYE